MISERFNSYEQAEQALIFRIITDPDIVTTTMHEVIGASFILTNPHENMNRRSNYRYAEHFFMWLMTGEKELSRELIEDNPWVKRFVDTTNLPNNYSASYGWKIKEQMPGILKELQNVDSRRAYMNILYPDDAIIRTTKTTHEYPCTIGIQFILRKGKLHMIVNMRSNNVYKVMPYDVYNFTRLQSYVAQEVYAELGHYHHQINSAHIFNGDARRIKEEKGWMQNTEI